MLAGTVTAAEPAASARVGVLARARPLLVTLGLLLALRVPLAFQPALWVDEVFSLRYPMLPLSFLWGEGWRVEPTPPLYYTALWAWLRVFGASEAGLRLLSVLFAALTLPLVHRLGELLGGRRAGLVAGLLFVLLPAPLEYSLEIRAYSLQGFLLAVALWALARTLRGLERGAVRGPADLVRLAWPLVPGAGLAVYTHATSVFGFAAVEVGFLAYWAARRPAGPAVLAAWLGLGALVAASAAPQLAAMAAVVATNGRTLEWIPPPTPYYLLLHLRELLAGQHSHGLAWANPLAVALAGLFAWAAWARRRDPVALAVGVAVPGVGVGLMALVSLAQPILLPRTVLWVLMPLSALLGSALAWASAEHPARGPALRWAAGLAVVALATFGTSDALRRTETRPWRAAIAEQTLRARAGDHAVAIDTETNCMLDTYGGPEVPAARRWVLAPGERRTYEPTQGIDLGCNLRPALTRAGIETLLADGAGVWVLSWQAAQTRDLEALLRRLPPAVRVTDRIARESFVFVRLSR